MIWELNILGKMFYFGENQVNTAAHSTMDDLKWQQIGYMSH